MTDNMINNMNVWNRDNRSQTGIYLPPATFFICLFKVLTFHSVMCYSAADLKLKVELCKNLNLSSSNQNEMETKRILKVEQERKNIELET